MKTSVHLLISSVLAAIIYPSHGWKVLLILVGGVLIDIDHYIWYACKYRNFNIVKSYRFYLKNLETNNFSNVYGLLLVFHTAEFLLAMSLFSFYNEYALLFTIGLLTHYIADLIFTLSVAKRFVANHSIISWILKNKQKV